MAYAKAEDVESRLGRELTTGEVSQVGTLLDDVEIVIKAKIPDLDDQVTAGTVTEATVVMVESNAVIRVLKNPDGILSETDGDYSYQKSGRLASGVLELLESEWALLGWSRGVFLIAPKVPTPFESAITDPSNPLFYYAPMFWNPL